MEGGREGRESLELRSFGLGGAGAGRESSVRRRGGGAASWGGCMRMA